MPLSRTVFRFTGADQATGDRHTQQGVLAEARNVRQIKAGSYRKRRAFDRAAVAETFVIGTTAYRPAPSSVTQGHFGSTQYGNNLSAANESVLGGAGAGEGITTSVYNWPEIGASRLVVGVCGVATVTTNPVTLRLRLGGNATPFNSPAGTVVGTVVLPVGANQTFDLISSETSSPGSLGTLQVTAESPTGSAVILCAGVSTWVRAIGGTQSIFLSDVGSVQNTGTPGEVVRKQWYVDFGCFDSAVTSLRFALCCATVQSFGGIGVQTVRVGGTLGAADGTIAAVYSRSGDNVNVALSGIAASFPKPSGVQLVKFTMNGNLGSFCESQKTGLLIRAE